MKEMKRDFGKSINNNKHLKLPHLKTLFHHCTSSSTISQLQKNKMSIWKYTSVPQLLLPWDLSILQII